MTQTTQSLQQDFTAVTASLLVELVALQRATATGGDISQVPPSLITFTSAVSPSLSDIWLNGLWIVSLVLTLSTAVLAGLVKQWLHFYLTDVTGSPKRRACTRKYRYTGLSQWGVPTIIEILPVMMNTSLFLFFIGLILFVQDLASTDALMWLLVGLASALFGLYVLSALLPLWLPRCPYKTSLSTIYAACFGIMEILFFRVQESSRLAQISLKEKIRSKTPSSMSTIEIDNNAGGIDDARTTAPHQFQTARRRRSFATTFRSFRAQLADALHPRTYMAFLHVCLGGLHRLCKRISNLARDRASLKVAEANKVGEELNHLQLDIVHEMIMNSTNPTVLRVALQSLSGIHASPGANEPEGTFFYDLLTDAVDVHFRPEAFGKFALRTPKTPSLERYARAMLSNPNFYTRHDYMLQVATFCTPPTDLKEAVLLASISPFISKAKEGMTRVVQFLIAHPPFELSRIHPWQVHQLRRALIQCPVVPVGQDGLDVSTESLALMILKIVSPDGPISLQVDLLLLILYIRSGEYSELEPLDKIFDDVHNDVRQVPLSLCHTFQLTTIYRTIVARLGYS